MDLPRHAGDHDVRRNLALSRESIRRGERMLVSAVNPVVRITCSRPSWIHQCELNCVVSRVSASDAGASGTRAYHTWPCTAASISLIPNRTDRALSSRTGPDQKGADCLEPERSAFMSR